MTIWTRIVVIIIGLLHYNEAAGQQIIKQDGKYGLTDEKGNVLLKTEYDKIELFDQSTPSCFIVKKNRKFGYVYKVELDSTKWLDEDKRYWTYSKLDFDTIYGFIIGGARYSTSFGYTTMGYKKNNRWGMICIQTHAGSGGGIFPSMGFYVGGMGKATLREAKYDTIIQRESADDFYTTRLNGKYGFWEPVSNEVYEPEFDSIPITIRDYSILDNVPRMRYAKKNGRWGIIYLNETTKEIEYKVPCLCNGLGEINKDFYYCMGQNDTLKIYYTKTQQTFIPLIDGKPIIARFYWKPWENEKFSFQAYIGKNPGVIGIDSVFYDVEVRNDRYIILDKKRNKKEIFPVESFNFQILTTISVFVFDITEKKLSHSFTDTTCTYFSGYTPFIIKADFDSKTNRYTRTFYDDQTGVLIFSIKTPEPFLFMTEVKKGNKTWYKFTSYRREKSENGATRGYYSLSTKKFSKFRR